MRPYSLSILLLLFMIFSPPPHVLKLSQRRFYEKPTKKRERLEYEKCNRLYNKEMKRKIQFIMKQHDPLPPI